MSEALQKLILDTLDLRGSIPDTRAIVLPGHTQHASESEAQIIILGALNSLLSREVNLVYIFSLPLSSHIVR
jgi:phenylalanyl-tRNA synthetase alpha chain